MKVTNLDQYRAGIEAEKLARLGLKFSAAGSLSSWQQYVGNLCPGNNGLLLAVSGALAAPVLELCGFPSYGLHFYGGKAESRSACVSAAASVWGDGSSVQPWRSSAFTNPSLAGLMGALFLDNGDAALPENLGSLIVEAGKGAPWAQANPKATLFISAGPDAIEQAQCLQLPGVIAWHVLSIPIAADFAELHGHRNAEIFTDYLKRNASKAHGVPAAAILQSASSMGLENLKTVLSTFMDLFKAAADYDGADEDQRVVLAYLALVCSVGELATTLDVTGWKEGAVIEAGLACFRASVEPSPPDLAA
ncbi:MAG: DUF927 domain-containing protein [Pseudomonadaceae bacterium]|jgi:putative DNA primase/helicase